MSAYDDGDQRVGTDGTLRVPDFELPPSPGWSAEATKVFLKRFRNNPVAGGGRVAAGSGSEEERWLAGQRAYRSGMELLHRRLVEKQRATYDVEVEETELGGVRVEIVTPSGGVRDSSRVLVNLHGGAFVGGGEACGLVESIPIAATGGMRVVAVDYRQGWEHRFPAASEDAAAVFLGLAAEHGPASVGVYGYSAGASLTGQLVAWLLDKGQPLPGAVAMCSGGAGVGFGGGDGAVFGAVGMGDAAPPVPPAGDGDGARFGYLAGIDPRDPLVAPAEHPAVLAGFPPSLLLTGTRSFDLSGAVTTHRRLLAAGVPAELHVWEGMWHCFPYHHDMPESQEAYATILDFFARNLT